MSTKYELEKQRRYYYPNSPDDTFKVIAESNDNEELKKIAEAVKLKSGKTYYEVLNINELDENGDIVDVNRVKTQEVN